MTGNANPTRGEEARLMTGDANPTRGEEARLMTGDSDPPRGEVSLVSHRVESKFMKPYASQGLPPSSSVG